RRVSILATAARRDLVFRRKRSVDLAAALHQLAVQRIRFDRTVPAAALWFDPRCGLGPRRHRCAAQSALRRRLLDHAARRRCRSSAHGDARDDLQRHGDRALLPRPQRRAVFRFCRRERTRAREAASGRSRRELSLVVLSLRARKLPRAGALMEHPRQDALDPRRPPQQTGVGERAARCVPLRQCRLSGREVRDAAVGGAMKIVTLLAGGWSASQVDLAKLPGTVIAVNDAAYYAPRWDLCVSMDRLWTENRWHLIEHSTSKRFWLRRCTMKNVSAENLAHVTLFDNDHKASVLSDRSGTLNGTNSGLCALNLAFQMRPQRLILVGFDMALGPRGERHWFPDYPWKSGGGSKAGKLAEWAQQMHTAAAQLDQAGIEVRVCAERSPVQRWPRLPPRLIEEAACAA